MFAFEDSEHIHMANMHFPNLRSFAVVSYFQLTQRPIPAVVGRRLTNFLRHHETIEELWLDLDSIPFDMTLFNANSLPRLRVFEGTSSVFNRMLLAQPECLSTTLRRLSICALSSTGDPAAYMFSILQSSRTAITPARGWLSMLQQITFSDFRVSGALLRQIIDGSANRLVQLWRC